jgi:hypothetical protein
LKRMTQTYGVLVVTRYDGSFNDARDAKTMSKRLNTSGQLRRQLCLQKAPRPLKDKALGADFAGRTGLEPATSAVTGRHSNQLNYHPFFGKGLQI